MTSTRWVGVGALMLMVAVAAGAFGAHGLRGRLDAYALQIYEKAVFYHLTHALGVVLVGVVGQSGILSETAAGRIALMLLIGVLLFSGSLYLLAVTGIRWLGAITPLGGSLFILAWGYLAWGALFTTK